MARPSPIRFGPSWLGPRLRFGIVVAVVIIAAFLPPRLLYLAGWAAEPVRTIIAPAQHRLGQAAAWLRGRTSPASAAAPDPEREALIRENEQLKFGLLQARDQIKQLQQLIADLSHSVSLNPDERIRLVNAPVIGGPADLTSKLLTVRVGRANGVEPNAVAVTHGVHLVGLVRSASDRMCTVLPITDRNQRAINAVIMLDSERRGPVCQLTPDGRGRLEGPVRSDTIVRDPVTGVATPIEPGMIVRFEETPPEWPRSANMLIVGRVVSVEPLPNQPQRLIVTVEPVYAPDRVTEVTIRSLFVGERIAPSPADVEARP